MDKYDVMSILCVLGPILGTALMLRARRLDTVPRAELANLRGVDAAVARVARARRQLSPQARGRRIAFGLMLILVPWIALIGTFLYELFSHPLLGEHNSKGRVLRIRNRAVLPEAATGTGWCDPVAIERPAAAAAAVIGELWLVSARMEHASIAAFSQLAVQLLALGAPARLVADTQRAAGDEIRHARASFSIASALLGVPQTAGPIRALGGADEPGVDLTRLALGTLLDGCLAEGVAADVAARGAHTATEPQIRATLAMIARDEARHAELGWDVLAWCLAEGGDPVRAAVAARVARLGDEVTPRLPDLEGVDAAAQRAYGLVDQDVLGELAAARLAAVQARASSLLADVVLAA